MISSQRVFVLFTLFSVLFGDIKVINKSTPSEISIKTLKGENKIYVSTKDLVAALSSRLYENLERKKLVLYVSACKEILWDYNFMYPYDSIYPCHFHS